MKTILALIILSLLVGCNAGSNPQQFSEESKSVLPPCINCN